MKTNSLWNRPFVRFAGIMGVFCLGVMAERFVHAYTTIPMFPAGQEKKFSPFLETWQLIQEHYVDRTAVNPERMTRGAIHGLVNSLGDYGHSTYKTAEEYASLQQDLKGELVGIGAQLGLRGNRPIIVRTFPSTPARQAGLHAGDVILKIDEQDVQQIPLDKLVSLVRGEEGTQVTLLIERSGAPKPLSVTIMRRKVEIPEVTWSRVGQEPILHLAISNFGHNVHSQLRAAIEDAKKKQIKGLIVDLRGNPGGLKDQAVLVTSEFLTSGSVFIQQDATGRREHELVAPGGGATTIPLVVLIDEGSASSSEIMAGALQDHKRAKLVGARTFGTGTVLHPFALSDKSAVLLAVYQWLTPNGRKIWHEGIEPDVKVSMASPADVLLPETDVPLSIETLNNSKDEQLKKALDILKTGLQ